MDCCVSRRRREIILASLCVFADWLGQGLFQLNTWIVLLINSMRCIVTQTGTVQIMMWGIKIDVRGTKCLDWQYLQIFNSTGFDFAGWIGMQ